MRINCILLLHASVDFHFSEKAIGMICYTLYISENAGSRKSKLILQRKEVFIIEKEITSCRNMNC